VDKRRRKKNRRTWRAYLFQGYWLAEKGRPNMDGKVSDSEIDCNSELHGEHLCYIISQGFNLTDEQNYRALVEKPAFRCGHCGRTAKSAGNLCVPDEL